MLGMSVSVQQIHGRNCLTEIRDPAELFFVFEAGANNDTTISEVQDNEQIVATFEFAKKRSHKTCADFSVQQLRTFMPEGSAYV